MPSQVGPTILSNPEGSYNYLITVYTGKRQQAGTTARIVFKMGGDQDETLPVRLQDRSRPCFKRGQDNAFIVAYPQGIGDLSYVQIWHDNSGSAIPLGLFIRTQVGCVPSLSCQLG